RSRRDQDSFDNFVSSMAISLNSLDSKTSPHSKHSTNSASSSRATICTRGCLHFGMLLLFSGSWDGGVGVIKSGDWVSRQAVGNLPEIGGILERPYWLSSPWRSFSCKVMIDSSFRGLESKRLAMTGCRLACFG